MFLNLLGAAEGALIRAAASTQTFGGLRLSHFARHAEQKSRPIHSLNIPDHLVSSPGRLPAPHNLRLNPVLSHHRRLLYARTRVCHFDLTEAGISRFVEAIRVHAQELVAALALNNDRRLRMVHRPGNICSHCHSGKRLRDSSLWQD